MTRTYKKDIYPIIANAIRKHGAEKVRTIVYGSHSALVTNEAVAISKWIDSRMFSDELLEKIKSL